MKKRLGNLISFLINHGLIIILLALAFVPAAKNYYETKPLIGTDFFLTKSYVHFLSQNLLPRPFVWKNIWSAGYPLSSDYPTLHFYLILPLTRFLSEIQAIQVYMLSATFLFGLFAYFVFYAVSKSRLFSLVLAVLSFYSVGYYGSLIFGGGLPYYATQFFLPLVVWLIIRHYQSQQKGVWNRKYLILAGFLTGISFLAHPQAPVVSVVPIGSLFILFWRDENTSLFSRRKIIDLLIFGGIAFFTGFAFISPYLSLPVNLILSVLKTGKSNLNPAVETMYSLSWELSQLKGIITQTSPVMWPALLSGALVFLGGGMLNRKLTHKAWVVVPFLLSLGWGYFNLWTWAYRFNPLQGGWYRAFWSFPFIFGGIAAALWGAGSELIGRKLIKVLSIAVPLVLVGYLYVLGNTFFRDFGLGTNPSSAFPRNVNLIQTKEEESKLKSELLPSWLDSNDENHRMFSIDAGANLGWSGLFNLPLVQGYVDPPIPFVGRGYLYLTDTTLAKDEAVKRFNYTADEATEMAKYFIDWSAIRYFEGGYTAGRVTVAPLSKYVNDLVDKDQLMTFKNVLVYKDTDMPVRFYNTTGTHYYEFKPEYVTPILGETQASTIAVIGKFSATDLLSRLLMIYNLNSQKVVPIIGPEKIDAWSLDDYKKFDMVFLYEYDYDNWSKSWGILQQYVKGGGNLFVETGGDVKESSSKKLPAGRFPAELSDLFPVRKTDKGYFGNEWQFKIGNSGLSQNLKLEDFGPAKLDNEQWGVSYAEPGDVDSDAKVILTDFDKVIMAEKAYGQGKVIWSGMNLPYHVEYYKIQTERQFLLDILTSLVNLDGKVALNSKVDWVSPQSGKITVDPGSKGVLLKEYRYDGWGASIKSVKGAQSAKIYSAGPAYPGYMYISIPASLRANPVTVEFSYKGKLTDIIVEVLPIIIGLIIFDFLVLKGKSAAILGKITNRFSSHSSKWLGKEGDY